MKISVKRLNQNFHMQALNEEGNIVEMDGSPEIGGQGKGMRPMQLLLTSLGGCSSIDVLLILKKQKQVVEEFEVIVEGDREKIRDYSIFKTITLHFKIKGNVDLAKVEKAVQLSMEKYCSVAKTLEPTAKITYKITLIN